MQDKRFIQTYCEILKVFIILFSAWFLLIGINILPQHFIGDDLHLVRKYSLSELLNAWYNNWDPDNLETRAYRPIAILFYHFQGSLFGEIYYLHNLFSILLLFILVNIIIIFLLNLRFSKIQILIFLSLFIFSKTFSTLASWKTLSALIFCYACFFLVSIFFLKWLSDKKTKYLFYIFLFTFLSIFSREEIYHLPFYLIIIFFLSQTNKNLNLRLLRDPLILTISVVVTHYFLRLHFVPDAVQPEIKLSSLINFLRAGLASGLPGGIKSYENYEKILQLFWIFGLLFSVIIVIKQGISKIEIKKIILIFITICLLTTPMSVMIRDFGIFLPTIFTTLFIVFFVSKLIPVKSQNFHLLNKFNICILIIVLSSGIIGGSLRSIEHVKIWSYNSFYTLSSDSSWIYGERFKNISIPLNRKNFKINELKKFGIIEELSYDQLKEKISNDKEGVLSDVFISEHLPLKF